MISMDIETLFVSFFMWGIALAMYFIGYSHGKKHGREEKLDEGKGVIESLREKYTANFTKKEPIPY
ncbi:MAG: hypothetical protein WC332_09930, partial [Clostridia bacterium]